VAGERPTQAKKGIREKLAVLELTDIVGQVKNDREF
jgi:hypothetical protein